jgi:hypothetical protein
MASSLSLMCKTTQWVSLVIQVPQRQRHLKLISNFETHHNKIEKKDKI